MVKMMVRPVATLKECTESVKLLCWIDEPCARLRGSGLEAGSVTLPLRVSQTPRSARGSLPESGVHGHFDDVVCNETHHPFDGSSGIAEHSRLAAPRPALQVSSSGGAPVLQSWLRLTMPAGGLKGGVSEFGLPMRACYLVKRKHLFHSTLYTRLLSRLAVSCSLSSVLLHLVGTIVARGSAGFVMRNAGQ